jgi:hypothetical protein
MIWPTRVCVCVGALSVALSLAHSADLHVDVDTGQDIPACGGEVSPCKSIQQAVNLSTSGDTILVADGTYNYQAGVDPCVTETAVVCIVEKELTLIGGYSPDWVTRDPVSTPTVIDGGTIQRGLLVMRTHPASPNNASLVLDGVTIRQGRAAGASSAPEDRFGGGLKAALVESLVLRDVKFENNAAEGDDTASGDGGMGVGGGAYISSAVSLPLTQTTMVRVTFSGNQAVGGTGPERGGFAIGGGLFINRSVFTASGIVFENNTATAGSSPGDGEFNGQRADALGGGMAMILIGNEATIDDLDVSGNISTGGSSAGVGGVGAGGGVYAEASAVVLRDSRLHGNTSVGGAAVTGGLGDGGGFASFDATVTLDRVAIIDNHAIGGNGSTTKGAVGGGGAYFERAVDLAVNVVVLNSIIADNSVSFGTGGGIVGGGGGGLFVLGIGAEISHTTLAQNSVGSDPLAGQAVTVANRLSNLAHADIEHTIIADHTSLTNVPAVQVRPGASVDFNGGLFAGNDRDTTEGMLENGTIIGLATVNLASSADFVSPGSSNFDYHILSTSAARNQATGSTESVDFDKTYRAGTADIGADEYCSAGVEDLELSGETVNQQVTEVACRTITAGPYTVQSSGDVIFQAGGGVVLRNGFQLDDGASLAIIISLPE